MIYSHQTAIYIPIVTFTQIWHLTKVTFAWMWHYPEWYLPECDIYIGHPNVICCYLNPVKTVLSLISHPPTLGQFRSHYHPTQPIPMRPHSQRPSKLYYAHTHAHFSYHEVSLFIAKMFSIIITMIIRFVGIFTLTYVLWVHVSNMCDTWLL